jgi:hypothetical protein
MRTIGVVLALGMGVMGALLAGCGGYGAAPEGGFEPNGAAHRLPAKAVNDTDLRWRDIPGFLYAEGFRSTFSYADRRSRVSVTWDHPARTLSGTLTAERLKPNFAYQMKLVGSSKITSATQPPDPRKDAAGWASWQLGRNGRWWCATDAWNVSDADLESHLLAGHTVYGYLLFDFFITDAYGNATKPFALKSTYHVLWRVDQRARGANDSPIVTHDIYRGAWGYGLTEPPAYADQVGVYAEWEPNRPVPGEVKLPAGTYPVLFNITEESFHDNLGNAVPYGGFWAQVLEGDISFRDYDSTYEVATTAE